MDGAGCLPTKMVTSMNGTRVKPPACNVRHRGGFLSGRQCNELIDAFNDAAYNNRGRAFGTRTELDGEVLKSLVRPIREAAKEYIISRIDTGHTVIYPEYSMLAKMCEGDKHELHADAVTLQGEPNHTYWRTHTAMIYLNSFKLDYTGGEIMFPQFGIKYGPLAGTLVAFSTDLAHRHLVNPIESGERYSLALWYTTDAHRAERW
jgi:predicted 2-oxoglutarate/Fe(II)-dependent dioxygenase YbiX